MQRSVLSLALQKAHEAFANVHTKTFYARMLQAFEQFVECDSYPILVELVSQNKKHHSLTEASIKKLNNLYSLLDAHVYAKIGDIDQECKSLLAFLRQAYTELSTYQIAKIVLSVFYRSMFALMIYQYKEGHKGVKIPLSMYSLIEAD